MHHRIPEQVLYPIQGLLLKKSKFELFDPVMTLSDLTLRSKVKINATIVFYA